VGGEGGGGLIGDSLRGLLTIGLETDKNYFTRLSEY